jgi:hypothetical protein
MMSNGAQIEEVPLLDTDPYTGISEMDNKKSIPVIYTSNCYPRMVTIILCVQITLLLLTFLVHPHGNEAPIVQIPNGFIPSCVDMIPTNNSKYAIVMMHPHGETAEIHAAYKLSVRLRDYIDPSVYNATDRYIQSTDCTLSKMLSEKVVEDGLAAGFTHVCCTPPILHTMKYNRFFIWNMVQYHAVLFLENDIIPVGNVTNLFLGVTDELYKKDDTYLSWVKEKQHDTYNSGVLLAKPNLDFFLSLMTMLLSSGAPPPVSAQTILNMVCKSDLGKCQSMDYKYNTIFYEDHNYPQLHLLEQASLVHMVRPKPWYFLECHIWWGGVAAKICVDWEKVPMVIGDVIVTPAAKHIT